jgi:hypothetical protein
MKRWRRSVAVAVLVLAGGCGVPTDRSPRQIPADRVPFDLLNPQPVPASPTSAGPR